jgi:hypothetical protein
MRLGSSTSQSYHAAEGRCRPLGVRVACAAACARPILDRYRACEEEHVGWSLRWMTREDAVEIADDLNERLRFRMTLHGPADAGQRVLVLPFPAEHPMSQVCRANLAEAEGALQDVCRSIDSGHPAYSTTQVPQLPHVPLMVE